LGTKQERNSSCAFANRQAVGLNRARNL